MDPASTGIMSQAEGKSKVTKSATLPADSRRESGTRTRVIVPAESLPSTTRPSVRVGPTLRSYDAYGARLDQALDSMWMAYQPIVQAVTGSLFGYEALLRSDEPSLPDPGAILRAAERLGRLHDVGQVVRERASRPMVAVPPPTLLFVNLHAADLNDETLFSPTAPLTAIAPRVVLEITERASLDDIGDVASRVARLREHGFRIAIDDLGAGYSGLASFNRLAPDFVKLDMSLIRDIHKISMKRKLVHFVAALCRDLGISAVAEGIEIIEERDTVLELGCDLLQGYLLGKPGRFSPEVCR